ncbi:MAG: hypothetical protein U0Q11_06630 [Vicinamibacterales bacterium]
MMRSVSRADGFSLVELTLALALSLAIVSGVFRLVDPASGAFQTQPEVADVQQRLRATLAALSRDVGSAGGAPYLATGADVLSPAPVAAVFPMRLGRTGADAAGTYNPARLTVWSVSSTAPQARLSAPLASASGTATITPGAGCRAGAASCGFQVGATVIVFGVAGAWDLFSITRVAGNAITLQHNLADSSLVHPANDSTIAEVTMRTHLVKDDPATAAPRVVRYDGAGGADVPVVDHVVDLNFELLGEAEPPAPVPGTGPAATRVTYGPPPPASGLSVSSYPPGENCAFSRTPGGAVTPRLPPLAAGPVLVTLPPASLVDGPWCPDSSSPNRYDADLLRVRAVIARVRVEAAIEALRGPAGPLFTRGGTARGNRLVPDRVAETIVVPRALNRWR